MGKGKSSFKNKSHGRPRIPAQKTPMSRLDKEIKKAMRLIVDNKLVPNIIDNNEVESEALNDGTKE